MNRTERKARAIERYRRLVRRRRWFCAAVVLVVLPFLLWALALTAAEFIGAYR